MATPHAEAPPLADLTQYLRPGLPYAFDHALRHVLARSGDPLGDPPPGSVAALARKLALNRSNLQRRAPQFRVDLGGLIGGTRARWALARMRRPEDVPEAMRAMGIKDPRTLGNLLHANAGCSLREAWTIDPETTIGPILVALGRAAEVAQPG